MSKILVLRPNEMLHEVNVDEEYISLETLQYYVDGNIELVRFNRLLQKHNIDMWINEEGKLIDEDANVLLLTDDMYIADVLVGTIVFAGHDNDGNSLPLTDNQIRIIKDIFDERIVADNKGNRLVILYM